MKKAMYYAITLIACLGTGKTDAQNIVNACNGKVYKVGDTLRIGKAPFSGYLYMKAVDEKGGLNPVKDELLGTPVIITKIPDYDQKLYENLGIYEKEKNLQVVEAEGNNTRYYVSLNEALSRGNIISDYKQSSVKESEELSPAILFVYAKKLYGTPVDQEAIDLYASLCDSEAFSKASGDPFSLEELRADYKNKLESALAEVDFNKVFRIKCLSELGQYDMTKLSFPLSGFSCPGASATKQESELSKLGYCLWGNCAFHFTNAKDFYSLPCPKERAKGFYSMRKYARTPEYNHPLATSYVYVQIKNKPVTLPAKKIMVYKTSGGFDFDWSTLDKVYGKRVLDMDIIQVDAYNDLLPQKEGELMYNYLGTQKK